MKHLLISEQQQDISTSVSSNWISRSIIWGRMNNWKSFIELLTIIDRLMLHPTPSYLKEFHHKRLSPQKMHYHLHNGHWDLVKGWTSLRQPKQPSWNFKENEQTQLIKWAVSVCFYCSRFSVLFSVLVQQEE